MFLSIYKRDLYKNIYFVRLSMQTAGIDYIPWQNMIENEWICCTVTNIWITHFPPLNWLKIDNRRKYCIFWQCIHKSNEFVLYLYLALYLLTEPHQGRGGDIWFLQSTCEEDVCVCIQRMDVNPRSWLGTPMAWSDIHLEVWDILPEHINNYTC